MTAFLIFSMPRAAKRIADLAPDKCWRGHSESQKCYGIQRVNAIFIAPFIPQNASPQALIGALMALPGNKDGAQRAIRLKRLPARYEAGLCLSQPALNRHIFL
jgi:hypothetical protein